MNWSELHWAVHVLGKRTPGVGFGWIYFPVSQTKHLPVVEHFLQPPPTISQGSHWVNTSPILSANWPFGQSGKHPMFKACLANPGKQVRHSWVPALQLAQVVLSQGKQFLFTSNPYPTGHSSKQACLSSFLYHGAKHCSHLSKNSSQFSPRFGQEQAWNKNTYNSEPGIYRKPCIGVNRISQVEQMAIFRTLYGQHNCHRNRR